MAVHLTCASKSPRIAECTDCEQLEGRVEELEEKTDTMQDKLDTIEPGAEVNVQADWAQTNTSADDYIKNKPVIPDGDKTFVYVQSTASARWAIQHNLDKMPSVTVVDSAGSIVTGDCDYIDQNNVVVSFHGEFAGKAYLN